MTCFYWFSIIIPIIAVLGICGNLMAILVLQKYKMLRCTTRLFLIGLAISNMAMLLFVSMYLELEGINCLGYQRVVSWRLHIWQQLDIWQSLAYYLSHLFSASSFYMMATLSVDRYIIICHQQQAPVYSTPKRTKIALAVVLSLAAVSTIPTYYDRTSHSYWTLTTPNDTQLVYPKLNDKELSLENAICSITIGVGLGASIMLSLVLNILILKRIKGRMKTSGRISSARRRDDRSSMMLVVVISVLIICSVPTCIHRIMWPFLHETVYVNITRMLSGTGLIVYASINFVVYFAMSKKFRHSFMVMLNLRSTSNDDMADTRSITMNI